MWKKLFVLSAVTVAFGVGGAQADQLAYARTATVLRADASTQSRVVSSVAPNTEISVRDCGERWCRARLGTKSGFISVSALEFEEGHDVVVERRYVEPEYVYPGPTYYYGPGPFYGPRFYGYYGGFHGHWRR